jgi:hypothetical protein
MKLKHILASAFTLALVTLAQAADVTVDITGATAFRVATLDSIRGRYNASGVAYKFAHDAAAGSFNGSTQSIFVGTFPGVTGTTTIRCSFNGSVEGIKALVTTTNDPLYPNVTPGGAFALAAGVIGGQEFTPLNGANGFGAAAAQPSEIAFSDVTIASTPLSGTLEPATPAAGVVTFTCIANEGASANLTNITSQNFRALFSSGFQPLSLFTGISTDSGDLVFATGRNDGSGTRTTYLAETGYGIANVVNQFVTTTSTTLAISDIQRVPAHGGSVPANASTIWGNDVDGNGGYSSGSALRTDMGKTTASVNVRDADNSLLTTGPLTLVTWLSTGDALVAKNAGAKILGYNGALITPIAAGLSAADKDKVVYGVYTAWGYEEMYRKAGLGADTVTVYNGIKSNLVLGASGIPIADMLVSRSQDGGIVGP